MSPAWSSSSTRSAGGANQRISELSGAVFGDGYEALRSEGSYLLDSTAPAWRFAVLRSLAADKAIPMAHDLQRRHSLDGADLQQLPLEVLGVEPPLAEPVEDGSNVVSVDFTRKK